ncbi:EpsI domain-containing exosortase [Sphingobium sp. SCG-1]|uniref:exosortase A n=1 Tax=Sphingobium sp. SCG-1 TaxID=2072936 RepID=UPI000CD6B2A6|nr:exosortase A [Sphingobium sp. SCG-1]AUW58493.1 EpsI domain-containing exosortase [Sphingobium sp. SCG-1]
MSAAAAVMPSRDFTGWRAHLIALSVVAGGILLLFAHDAFDMVRIWWTASTFQHCLFVPFLIGWLVQQRVPGLRQLSPQAWTPGLLWLGLGGFAWLLGDAAGVALFRHGGLVVMLQGAVLAILGPRVSRALMFPLFYALFMVPFGEEIVPSLQFVTAHISMILLGIVGVPAHMDGVFITTPTGYFEVAEACSGAKFLIAMAAYGALVGNVCFRRWSRRILFVGGALILSVLANGVRAFATILVAHLTTVDAAVGFDHVVFGWVFFGIMMTIVMLVAWPFFDRKPGDPWFDPANLQGSDSSNAVTWIAPMAIAVAALAPALSSVMASRTAAVPASLSLPNVPGWSRSPAPQSYPWTPNFSSADSFAMGRYADAQGHAVDLAIAVYARQQEGRELVGFGQGAVGPDSKWAWTEPAAARDDGLGQRITAPGPVVRDVITFYSVGGIVTGSAGKVKLETLKARLFGKDPRAVAILVSAEDREGHSAQAAMTAFLRSLGPVKELADVSAGIR